MLENLSILLDDGQVSTSTIANLPTNENVMQSFVSETVADNDMADISVKINELCVVVWQNCDSNYEWYLGYPKSVSNSMCTVDHLHRVLRDSHTKWKYPSEVDIQTVEPKQIVICDVEGQWDYTPDSRKRIFSVLNIKTICSAFEKHVK